MSVPGGPSVPEQLAEWVATLRASRGFAHKRDIGDVLGQLRQPLPRWRSRRARGSGGDRR